MSVLNFEHNIFHNYPPVPQSKIIRGIFLFISLISCLLSIGQSFEVGLIEVYGNYRIPDSIIRGKLGIATGDMLSPDSFTINKEVFRNRLLKVPGVKRAHITAVCCTPENKLILFAGVDENDSAAFSYRKPPLSKIKLPEEVTDNYNESMKIVREAVQTGNAVEDDSQGHALLNYPPAQPVQAKTISYANKYMDQLRKVLHSSADAGQRAVAAQVLAYGRDKKEIAGDLLYAVYDNDEDVRNNATRALGIIAGYANDKPELGITLPADIFIDMLNSVVWTDRNKGGMVLMKLTDKPNEKVILELKKKAVPALLQMAKWKSSGHSETFYFLSGRVAGFSNQEISDTFYSDRRNSFYEEIVKKLK